MILAWGILILSVFLFLLVLSIIINNEQTGKNFSKITLGSILGILASSQYIWG